MLETVVYTSAATVEDPDLDAILEVSRRNNEAAGLTGVLLVAEGNFIQALEGPKAAIAEVYARIVADFRHRLVIELYRATIAERNFPDWSMGCAFDLTRPSLEAISREGRGEEVFSLLKSFHKVAYRGSFAP